jgi:DNA-binding transcriptional MerR regulator
VDAGHMQIGEVAERVGLSLRTIRHYGEVGLIPPSARSKGGFRLYTEGDVARLAFIKRMKPLDFSLEEIGELLAAMETVADPQVPESERQACTQMLQGYLDRASGRVAVLREQFEMAEALTRDVRQHLNRHALQPGVAEPSG